MAGADDGRVHAEHPDLGLIEIRVTTAERKAVGEVGGVGEASSRSQVSWTASSASRTLPRIR